MTTSTKAKFAARLASVAIAAALLPASAVADATTSGRGVGGVPVAEGLATGSVSVTAIASKSKHDAAAAAVANVR